MTRRRTTRKPAASASASLSRGVRNRKSVSIYLSMYIHTYISYTYLGLSTSYIPPPSSEPKQKQKQTSPPFHVTPPPSARNRQGRKTNSQHPPPSRSYVPQFLSRGSCSERTNKTERPLTPPSPPPRLLRGGRVEMGYKYQPSPPRALKPFFFGFDFFLIFFLLGWHKKENLCIR